MKSMGITDTDEAEWMRTVRRAVEGLRYGSVEVRVHDGWVVQVETRQKIRFAGDRRSDQRRRNEARDGQPDRQTGGAAPEESNE